MDNQNQIFSDYTLQQSRTHTVSKTFMANVFLWMGGALLISAFFAWLFATNDQYMAYLLQQNARGGLSLSTLGWVVMFAPLGFVLLMSMGYSRLSAPVMGALFVTYAAITGISLSFILLTYTASSVVGCFLSASAMFIVMAVMGYTTNKDLTSFGRILTMGLIGMLVAMLINFFLRSDTMGYLISIIGVAVFTGLTAYDVQKLKHISMGLEQDGEGLVAGSAKKLSILGALTLYLDFINLFLFLLRLFGSRRN